MPLYEVEVKTVSSAYYLVEAKTELSAKVLWSEGVENGEFVESQQVVAVLPYDERFIDDNDLIDEYEEEQFDADE